MSGLASTPTNPHFCTKCGQQTTPEDVYCANCGHPLSATQYPPPPDPTAAGLPAGFAGPPDGNRPPSNRNLWIVAAILAALLLVIVFGGGLFVFLKSRSQVPSVPATPTPTVAPSQQPAQNGVSQVTVTVTGCDDCTINAKWSAFSPQTAPQEPAWTSGELRVANGKVSFPVPVDKSTGLAFEVTSPREKAKDAIPVAVVKYSDLAVGAPVNAAQAAAGKSAYGCWAGTTFAEAALNLQVDWYTGTDFEGKPAQGLRAYFNPGLATYGDPQEAFDGTLAHQNIRSCLQ
jgi:hypothetical protein